MNTALHRAARAAACAAAGAAAVTALPPAPAVAAPRRPQVAFHIADPQIVEASGIAIGHRSPGLAYVHNDSGDRNRFFALDDRTGATAATVIVTGARNVDWEDITVAPDPAGASSVWIADTGDNDEVRREVQIYRMPEPQIARTDRGRVVHTARPAVWRLRYPTGAANAESLAVSPDGTAYVVTKSPFGSSTIYRVPPRPDRTRVQLLKRVGAVQFVPHGSPNPYGAAGELVASGADLSPDGTVLAVRTYADAYLWPVSGGDVRAALTRAPTRVRLPRQPLGEGIALVDDRTALIDSEGRHSAVYTVPLPPLTSSASSRPAATVAGSTPSPTDRTPTSTGAAPEGEHRSWWPIAGAGAGVALLGAAVWGWRRGRIKACRSPRSTKP